MKNQKITVKIVLKIQDGSILKCEIKFRYKFRRYIHILTGDITVKDIFSELLNILKGSL